MITRHDGQCILLFSPATLEACLISVVRIRISVMSKWVALTAAEANLKEMALNMRIMADPV